MIGHELLFLGLLKDGPKHGYEIKRLIEEELFPFVGLKIKSIYYPLKKMEKLGLIKKDVGREGRWPEKYVYSLTPKGEKIFDHLITESFLTIERPYFNIDLSLYFLPYVEKKIAKRQLRGRILFLRRIRRDLQGLQKTMKTSSSQRGPNGQKHVTVILDHDLDLVEAEIRSIGRLMETLL
ncbi:MAG: PadR family transcriptional regulator [Candidatus Omnitrophica bacterium]|nr:PadR family transcriptional regulator [Candidatus Omnitrophota bacterium]